MNRTALCIRMLQLLKSRGFLTSEEIANELNMNQRNVREFRRELEMAGYIIETTPGKYGGYRLLNDCLLPSVAFTKEELRSLKELQTYILSHPDFLMAHELNHAIDKMLSNTTFEETHTGVYLEYEQYIVSEQMRTFIDLMEQAIQKQVAVELSYRTLKRPEAKRLRIHPYEIINYKGAYYCIAYSLQAKDYRIYKFSEERMKDCLILDQQFQRDPQFDIKKHIGESGLVKDDIIEVALEIYEEAALLTAEKQIGLHPVHHWITPSTLYYQTIFEGKQVAISFILSLGANAKVLSPPSLKEEICHQAEAIKQRYS